MSGGATFPPGNRYFIEGSDQLWSNASNWWLDDAGTIPAGSVPTSLDDCFIQSGGCGASEDYLTLTVVFGATLASSNEDIVTNAGTVLSNSGTVTTNTGTVENNTGTGVISVNNGLVTGNSGLIAANNSIVTTNNAGGNITTNNGIVSINATSGVVSTNSYGAEVGNNIGTVTSNSGNVTSNPGTVTINEDSGIILDNTASGTVANNGSYSGAVATVSYNAGTIVNCYGPVTDENGGYITNDYRV